MAHRAETKKHMYYSRERERERENSNLLAARSLTQSVSAPPLFLNHRPKKQEKKFCPRVFARKHKQTERPKSSATGAQPINQDIFGRALKM